MPAQPDEQDAAERVGQVVAGTGGWIGGGDELLREERVAIGPSGDRVEQGGRHRRAEDPGQEVGQLVSLEPHEVEAVHPGLPFRFGQPGGQGMTAMELIGAKRPDDAQAFDTHVPPQERQQVAGRSVRPVEVLDDEEDGPTGREPREQRQHPLEDPDLKPVGPGMARRGRAVVAGDRGLQLGDESGEHGERRTRGGRDRVRVHLTGQGSKHLHDRAEREGVVAEGHGPALEDEPVVVTQACRGLGNEAALADSRLAADEHDRRSGCLRGPGRREERSEFVGSADEHRAAQAAGHAADHRR